MTLQMPLHSERVALEGEQDASACDPSCDSNIVAVHPVLPFVPVVFITVSTVATSQLTKSAQDGLHAPFFVMYTHLAVLIVFLPASRALRKNADRVRLNIVAVLLLFSAVSTFFYVIALAFAPPSLVQILFGVAPATVALLSSALLKEVCTVSRFVAVALAFLGTAMVGFGVESSPWRDSATIFIGGGLALLAVFAAASYKVLFKVLLGQPSLPAILCLLGNYGSISLVVGLPVSFLLSAFGYEDRWWDSTAVSVNWWVVVGSALIDLMYNASVACGLAISSPVFIALGVILGAPVNMFVDGIVRGIIPSLVECIGAAVIVVSFIILAINPTAGQNTSIARSLERSSSVS